MRSDKLIRPRHAVASAVVAAFASFCGVASTAQALVPYLTPQWSRPTRVTDAAANRSTYQAFDIFSDDDGSSFTIEDYAPDNVDLNPNGSTAFYELSGQAFIAGSGNVYGIGAPLDVNVHVPGYGPIAGASTTFLVQMQTEGTELVRPGDPPGNTYDFSRIAINGTPLTSLREFSYNELSRTPLPNTGTFGGYIVQHAFAFTLPTTASGYDFTYKTLDTHLSQAYLSVDTFVRIAGDFNYDAQRNVADLDLLLRAPRTTLPASVGLFDLNGDGVIKTAHNTTGSDADAWVIGLAHTTYGDTNLDGDVDFDDLLVLAKSYNASGASIGWTNGDFDGSQSVNFDDLLSLAKSYGYHSNSASAASFPADFALAQSLVPEPTAALMLSAAAVGLMRRRRVGG